MTFKSGDCAGQGMCEVHLRALQIMTEQFQLCEWGHCRLGKLHRCSEITSGSLDAPDYRTYSRTPCSNSVVKGSNGPNRIPRYYCPNHHRISPLFHCWSSVFRIVGFLGCSPNVNSSWCREQHEGRLVWQYHERVSSCLMSRFYGRDTIIYAFQ
jgi:hypothetical protein